MLTFQKIFSKKETLVDISSFLFFDIETTGFSKENTILYLIGCTYLEKDHFQLIQWFNDDGTSEKEILESFRELVRKKNWKLVTFNGLSFDIPYLNRHYELFEMESPLPSHESIDYYFYLKPFQTLFGMEHGRQKDWERFLGLDREDPFDGGQLIEVYKTYLLNKENSLLSSLLLHNEEDISGMLFLLPLFSYPALLSGKLVVHQINRGKNNYDEWSGSIQIHGVLEYALPRELAVSSCVGALSVLGEKFILTVPYLEGILKHFYKNYKEYYYLPEEDRAVHKSVGCYVDQKYRKSARASTCYIKKEGIFFHLPRVQKHYGFRITKKEYAVPLYQAGYKNRDCYIEFDDLFSEKETINQYITDIVREIFISFINENTSRDTI